MKRGEKYTFILSEREAGIVLAALEFVLKLKDLVPFRDEPNEMAAVKRLSDRIRHEAERLPTHLEVSDAQ